MSDYPLEPVLEATGGRLDDVDGIRMAVDYGDSAGEYAAGRSGAGLYDARDRGLIEIRGKDRTNWLHNLVTNVINPLQPGEGNYTFAVNVKGRILMDFNMLVLADAIWLDIDRRLVAKALPHFDRYTIAEDVQCKDRSGEFVRMAMLGPKAVEVTEALGATNAKAMPALGSMPVALAGKHRLMVRHDFAGLFGVEFYVEAGDAVDCWARLVEIGRPVGWSVINVLRIEAGIPWYGQDITEDILPAETDQIERAVSYVKGCYLGQEVVERMRSRGALARKLAGVRFNGSEGVEAGAELMAGGAEVGRLTSACRSPLLDAWIGLGYLRTAQASPGTRVSVAGHEGTEGEVVGLPFRR